MDRRTLDDEVCGRLAGTADLGPDPRIARLQGAIPQAGPIGSDRGIEGLAARRVDRIIDRRDPLDIRSESRLTRQIQGEVHAEATGNRNRINQPPKWRTAAERKIHPTAEIRRRDRLLRYSLDRPREGRGVESC